MQRRTAKPVIRRRRLRSIAQDPTVSRFVAVVEEYCQLLESGTRSRKRLLRRLVDILPELFCLALQLPAGRRSEKLARELHCIFMSDSDTWPTSEKDRAIARHSMYRHTHVSTQQFFAMTRRLSPILGVWDRYREVFNPFEDKDPIQTSVSNDLAEIWHDLKPMLLLYNMRDETSMRHAVHQWAFGVRVHWGDAHFAGAIKPIIRALKAEDLDWEFPGFS